MGGVTLDAAGMQYRHPVLGIWVVCGGRGHLYYHVDCQNDSSSTVQQNKNAENFWLCDTCISGRIKADEWKLENLFLLLWDYEDLESNYTE